MSESQSGLGPEPQSGPESQSGLGSVAPRVGPRLALLVCGLAIFTDVVGSGIVIPAIPDFAALFAASEAQIGYAFSAFALAFLVTVLPLGALVDRVGRVDLVLGAGMALIALAAVSFILASSIWVFSLAQALHGVGSAATWVSAQPLAARLASRGERQGLWMSVITLSMGLGLVFGPLVGAVGGLQTPFVLYLVLACAATATVLAALRDQEPAERTRGVRYVAVLANPRVAAACLTILVLYVGIGMLEVLFPLHMSANGYAKSGIGVLFFWLAIFLVGSQPLAGNWIDRTGPVTPMVASLVVVAAMLPLAVIAGSFTGWIPVFMVLGVATGIPVSASMLLVASASRPGERGVAYALWNLSFSVGYLVGPALGGTLAAATAGWGSVGGPPLAFFALSGVVLATAPAVALLSRHGR